MAVGIGVAICIGVDVGSRVTVGTDVAVGSSMGVGCNVAAGGTDVEVGAVVAVGGISIGMSVAVGVSDGRGILVGVGSGVCTELQARMTGSMASTISILTGWCSFVVRIWRLLSTTSAQATRKHVNHIPNWAMQSCAERWLGDHHLRTKRELLSTRLCIEEASAKPSLRGRSPEMWRGRLCHPCPPIYG